MAKATKKTQSKPSKQPVVNLQAAQESNEPTRSSDQTDVNSRDLGPRRRYRLAVWLAAAVIIVAGLFGGFKLVYASKIYPGVSVNGVYLGGLSQNQARQTLTKAVTQYQTGQIPVQYANTTLAVDLTQIGTRYNVDAAIQTAYDHGRNGDLIDQLAQIGRGLISRATPMAEYDFDEAKLTAYVTKIIDGVDTPVTNASLNFGDTGRVGVVPDQAGQRVNIGLLVAAIEQRIGTGSNDAITAPTYQIKPTISTDALGATKHQADTYLQGPLTLTLNGAGKTTSVQVKDMIAWLKISQPPAELLNPQLSIANFAYLTNTKPIGLTLDDAVIAGYVAGLAKTVDQPGQNAALTITNDVATVFQPEKTGYTLDQPAAVTAIKAGLAKPAAERALTLNVIVTQPAVTAASLNDLGINQLISEGVTTFPGSPAARMQNIRVGASKFNGVLVKPGDTFSFESLLGNVDAAAGYAPALVILGDHEEFQYGGGMCQVSSTAYRAALLAGLPILERHSHSFAVGYYTAPYGVPGVDATVFDASVDFKFKNDTGHYILIQTVLSGTTLKFDFYGTKTKTGVIHAPTFIDPPGGAGWNATVPSTTVFTRDILDLAGNVIKTDTIKTHYKSSLDFPVVKELN